MGRDSFAAAGLNYAFAGEVDMCMSCMAWKTKLPKAHMAEAFCKYLNAMLHVFGGGMR